jgi:superfamily II DNA or RNA helicase
VRRFLERQTTDIKVVFSTYQSSPVVGDGARGLPPFDFAVFDEAHKTIGLAGSAFGYALSDQNLRINKRLFLTATPRHIDIRHRDKEGEFRVYSMVDETVYGPRAHTLSFGAAAQKGIICRYKVIISLIDKQIVDDFTRKNGITLVEQDDISARWMANLIAVQQAIEKVNATKIITFHSRVRLAQEFATNQPRGIAYHLRAYDVRHVNGEQSSGERADIIRSFAETQRALLTNARCLTEGINIPAVDMVAFIDPRQSRVDITQAVGRAMRKPRSQTTKTFGYVVVPVFAGVSQNDTLESAIKSEKFEAVVDVLNALQEHDEELVDIIREIKERKGAGEVFNPGRLNEKVEVIGPRVDLDRLTTSIGVEITDRIGSSWDEWFGLLTRFKAREGHCNVQINHIESTLPLGRWVSKQRNRIDTMHAERRKRLDDIGFVWDSHGSAWEDGFSALTSFKAREGHCVVQSDHVEEKLTLGMWVNTQRTLRDRMLSERRKRLDAIGFVWEVLESEWQEGFASLKQFKAREGHCLVPALHIEGAFKLGGWVRNQRINIDKIPAERRNRLDNISFVWDVLEGGWEEGFTALTTFKLREGHCFVPFKHIEGSFKLGGWVDKQRNRIDTMHAERRKRLDDIGFVWNARESAWEEGFAALLTFKAREGHWRVPKDHVEGPVKLGVWVTFQRTSKNTMPAERRKRLDEIGFVWDVFETGWEEGFAKLTMFKAREGHCRVPALHIEEAFKLGRWVSIQRGNKDRISAKRRNRLDAIGFVWAPHKSAWEEGFAALTSFKAREEHCRAPHDHIEEAFRLGGWVNKQRSNKDNISVERRKRLDDLGFVWDIPQTGWEEAFSALTIFKAREGHLHVPKDHIEGKLKLGRWVNKQRTLRDRMPPERRKRLDAIGFVWDALENAWEEGFAALTKFRAREGHCRVPALHIEGAFKLGTWVSHRRKSRDTMPAERRKRLDAIGFVWDPFESAWEEGFATLKRFKAREGHCRVPVSYIERTFKLGQWVSVQRGKIETIPPERRKRLDEIGFIWRAK